MMSDQLGFDATPERADLEVLAVGDEPGSL
jgi:hypothetical protein